MNKGFTKLEIILVGVILLIAVGFMAKAQISNPTGEINQTPTKNIGLCTRTTPYDNPPEFTRAISLVNQRYVEAKLPGAIDESISNCIDIQYTDLSNKEAEGYFIFDPNSSTNDLKIYVDNSYKSYDDILTALLLSHELKHVQQFIDYKTKGTDVSCFDKEIEAFSWQFGFLTDLNAEERKSLYNRISYNPNINNAYAMTWQLIQLYNNTNDCSNENTCVGGSTMQQLKNMVINNPFYQKQCADSQ